MKNKIIVGITGVALVGGAVLLSGDTTTLADETITKQSADTIKVSKVIPSVPEKLVEQIYTKEQIEINILSLQTKIDYNRAKLAEATATWTKYIQDDEAELAIWNARLIEVNKLLITK